MLLLFCLNESAIYVFDSLKKERKIRLTIPARMAFKLYVSQSGLRNNRKEFIWHHTEVQCPQQVGGTECGFLVMRYMYDISCFLRKILTRTGKWFLVLGVMAKRKSMRFERFGLSFLLLNVSSRMAINAKTGVQKKELQEKRS
ncbi:uncharacterized protein LOC108192509 isoform X2 [Daucus carota subsp. sativus]|uniref:uncharacterized protein LOC108192509 isoform X2 n=1 Tax=Daucus carota subsp. sativus TaxID=79200 RepID=UPI003082952C